MCNTFLRKDWFETHSSELSPAMEEKCAALLQYIQYNDAPPNACCKSYKEQGA